MSQGLHSRMGVREGTEAYGSGARLLRRCTYVARNGSFGWHGAVWTGMRAAGQSQQRSSDSPASWQESHPEVVDPRSDEPRRSFRSSHIEIRVATRLGMSVGLRQSVCSLRRRRSSAGHPSAQSFAAGVQPQIRTLACGNARFEGSVVVGDDPCRKGIGDLVVILLVPTGCVDGSQPWRHFSSVPYGESLQSACGPQGPGWSFHPRSGPTPWQSRSRGSLRGREARRR